MKRKPHQLDFKPQRGDALYVGLASSRSFTCAGQMAASLVLRLTSKTLTSAPRLRILSRYTHSSMAGLLIEEPKYSFLKDLGLDKENKGVFYGQWGGQGEVGARVTL